LGVGSNTLIRDGGFNGIIIKLIISFLLNVFFIFFRILYLMPFFSFGWIYLNLIFSKKLLIHLGMSGTIHLIKKNNENNTNASFYHSSYLPQKHNHIEIIFNNDIKMIYNDPRRFGYFKLLKKNYLSKKPIINLGPDPFSYKFNLEYIKNFIYKKKINIKNY